MFFIHINRNDDSDRSEIDGDNDVDQNRDDRHHRHNHYHHHDQQHVPIDGDDDDGGGYADKDIWLSILHRNSLRDYLCRLKYFNIELLHVREWLIVMHNHVFELNVFF